MPCTLLSAPLYDTPVLEVTPLSMNEDHGDLSVDVVEACGVLDVCVDAQTQSTCDLVCEFQFGQVPLALPNIEHMWDDEHELMSSVELTESFSEFIRGGFDTEVADMVSMMERRDNTPVEAPPPDESSEADDLKDETYVPPVKKHRDSNSEVFMTYVHRVVSKFGTPMSLQDLKFLWKRHGRVWKDQPALDVFMKKKRRYFNIRGTQYTLSKYGRRRLKL